MRPEGGNHSRLARPSRSNMGPGKDDCTSGRSFGQSCGTEQGALRGPPFLLVHPALVTLALDFCSPVQESELAP